VTAYRALTDDECLVGTHITEGDHSVFEVIFQKYALSTELNHEDFIPLPRVELSITRIQVRLLIAVLTRSLYACTFIDSHKSRFCIT